MWRQPLRQLRARAQGRRRPAGHRIAAMAFRQRLAAADRRAATRLRQCTALRAAPPLRRRADPPDGLPAVPPGSKGGVSTTPSEDNQKPTVRRPVGVCATAWPAPGPRWFIISPPLLPSGRIRGRDGNAARVTARHRAAMAGGSWPPIQARARALSWTSPRQPAVGMFVTAAACKIARKARSAGSGAAAADRA